MRRLARGEALSPVRGNTKKKPWAQWYDVRPRVPHGHNHKGKPGNAGLLFSLKLLLPLLYCIRPETKSCRIIEHGVGLRSTARSDCAGNEGTACTLSWASNEAARNSNRRPRAPLKQGDTQYTTGICFCGRMCTCIKQTREELHYLEYGGGSGGSFCFPWEFLAF